MKELIAISTVFTILTALLVFGVLIFVHELGHYLTARLFHVRIKEFALGMGPKLFSHTSKKTDIAYSLRLLPFGGFVSMYGEDEESDDPNSLEKKPAWQRLIILAAGSFMNLLLGFVLVFLLVVLTPNLGSTEVREFVDASTSVDYGLQVGDTVTKVNGKSVHIADQLAYEIMFAGNQPVDLTVVRKGETLVLCDVVFPTASESGMSMGLVDFRVGLVDKTPLTVIKFTFYRSVAYVELIWRSLVYLVTGQIGFESVSGPVGVTSAIGTAAQSGLADLGFLCSIIALNLGIFNLLPLPALDGGRIVFILLEMIRGKPIKQDTEGMIHFIGLALLMLLMVVVTFKDIFTLFS
ncbi:MAG: site-2 protease family protein [Ruminococcaceae bacterium]|nr:site-2 protease family protein [Oscillospiraceae bacterium]